MRLRNIPYLPEFSDLLGSGQRVVHSVGMRWHVSNAAGQQFKNAALWNYYCWPAGTAFLCPMKMCA